MCIVRYALIASVHDFVSFDSHNFRFNEIFTWIIFCWSVVSLVCKWNETKRKKPWWNHWNRLKIKPTARTLVNQCFVCQIHVVLHWNPFSNKIGFGSFSLLLFRFSLKCNWCSVRVANKFKQSFVLRVWKTMVKQLKSSIHYYYYYFQWKNRFVLLHFAMHIKAGKGINEDKECGGGKRKTLWNAR